MSKRYGRNQRRKAREQIADLSRRHTQSELHNEDLQNRMRNLLEMADVMDEVLGKNFIGNENTYHVEPGQDFIRVPEVPNFGYPYGKVTDAREIAYKLHSLQVMETSVELDALREAMCVRVYIGGEAGMALNMTTRVWDHFPREYLIKDLSRKFAEMLVNKIQNK